MKKIGLTIVFSLLMAGLPVIGRAIEEKPWTFLVYIAAANNLYPFADRDLQEMMRIGSNELINILVYLTIQRFDEEKVTKLYYVTPGGLVQCGPDFSKDSGDRYTLMDALRWAHEDYPSEYFALILWDHGSGPLNRSLQDQFYRGICYDDDTGHYLTDLDYQYALQRTCERYRGGKKLDIVACDACLMANIEVAYALEPYARYFVASQETIPGNGYDYARVLEKFNYGSMKPEACARAMVEAYDKAYESTDDYTLSVMDLRYAGALAENISRLGWLLENAVKREDKGALCDVIWQSISLQNCTHFAEKTYIDLYEFYSNLLKRIHDMHLSLKARMTLTSTLMTGLRLINTSILENVHSENLNTVHGLSIYFPYLLTDIDDSYKYIYWSKNNKWLNFLEEYIKNK